MLTSRRTAALLTALGVLTVGVAEARAATSAQFAQRADAICRPLQAKLDAIAEPKSASEVVPYFEKNLRTARPALKHLQALTLPTDKRAAARRAVTYSAKEVSELQRTVTALKGGADPEATLKQAAERLDAIAKTQDRAWRTVGATDCAK